MAEDDQKKQPVIIKHVKKVYHKHHGGAWKIAYADFVTAMMTFFLLMWLLSLLNKYQLEGISQYFRTPLKKAFTKQTMEKSATVIASDKKGPSVETNTGAKFQTKNDSNKDLGNAAKSTQNNNVDNAAATTKPTVNSVKDLENLKSDLEKKMEQDPVMSQYKNQLNFVVTSDGLKIVMKDLKDKPMFSEGGLDFENYAQTILAWLTQQINDYSNRIMIIGHTDTLPYNSDHYTNWELSADRANATRRVLIHFGMDPDKVLRVVGGADTDLIDKKNGDSPSNRRIEIIMLTDKAVKRIQNE